MSIIEVNQITKDYGNQKGVFDVSFLIDEGEVVGFLGPNGSGKTTTIRQLMGFIKPDKGSVSILGKDCFKDAQSIHKELGYLPGEIAFMEEMKGEEYLNFMAKMMKLEDTSYMKELIEFLEIDTKNKIKKMSKGMKQKIGIITALMHQPKILILDEPTSGLDPLMQNKFVELIQKEKEKGTTVLMSSHIFEEVENTCDTVIIIKEGKIVAKEAMEKVRNARKKQYTIVFKEETKAIKYQEQHSESVRKGKEVSFLLTSQEVDAFLKEIVHYEVEDMNIHTQTLEELFLHFYGDNA